MITFTSRCEIYNETVSFGDIIYKAEIVNVYKSEYKITLQTEGDEDTQYIQGYIKNHIFIIDKCTVDNEVGVKRIVDYIENIDGVWSIEDVSNSDMDLVNSDSDLNTAGRVQAYNTFDEITSKYFVGDAISCPARHDTIQTALEFQKCYKTKFDGYMPIYLYNCSEQTVQKMNKYYHKKFKHGYPDHIKDVHAIVVPYIGSLNFAAGQTTVLDNDGQILLTPHYLYLESPYDYILTNGKKDYTPPIAGDIKELNLSASDTSYFLEEYNRFHSQFFVHTVGYTYYTKNKEYQLYVYQGQPHLRVYDSNNKILQGAFFPIECIYDEVPELVIPTKVRDHRIVEEVLKWWGLKNFAGYFPTLESLFLSIKLGTEFDVGNIKFQYFLDRYPQDYLDLSFDKVENLSDFNTIPEQYSFDIARRSKIFKTALKYLRSSDNINFERKNKILKNFPQIEYI